MPDRWMDERERRWRDRSNWRSEAYGRGGEGERQTRIWGEDRTWGGPADDDYGPGRGARFEGRDRDRVFGEEDSGVAYNRPNVRPGGGAYGAGGGYGGGESYGRGAGGGRDWRDERGGRQARQDRPAWQDRDYGGVSPAMEHDEYDAERDRERGLRFGRQDYTRGGRFYGDDRRQPIYREEWGQGAPEYGPAPRGYDAGRERGGYGSAYGNRELESRYAREMGGRMASGGVGGYDFERGYGDGGREQERGGWDRDREAGRDRSGGGFFQKVTNWFGDAVDEVRRDLSGERSGQRYGADYGREARREAPWEDRGHRGRGPKDYKRSDERISDEAHDRLTDDPWLDASNINVSVSGGEVTLSGTVETREAKHRAERLVEDISGVSHVQNNLRIDQGGFFTSPGKGYGDSVMDAQMRDEGATAAGKSGEDTASTRSTTRRT